MSAPALRFFSGGGEPPRSHEVLLVEPGGEAWYLTGMPWPAQPPFDEIGAYHGALGPPAYERLVQLARAAIAAPPAPDGPAGSGTESVRLGEQVASWARSRRPDGAGPFADAARAAIATLRDEPYAVARAELVNGERVRITNPGSAPLQVADGEVRAGWGHAGTPATPWHFARSDGAALALPAELEPGAELQAPLPPPAAPDDERLDTLYALVRLRWRSPVASEGDELDGWIIAGPPDP